MLAPILGWTVLLFFGRVPTLTALPIAGLSAKDLQDTFDQTRGSGKHEAIDIMSPRGTPVHAVVDGTIAKLFLSKPGGKTIYLFDGDGLFCYYYAHLDRYAPNLLVGQRVSLGQVIAYVGSTGNANPSAPHLHFTIFELGPEKHWWQGVPINPYPALIRLLSNSREMKHQEHSYESGLGHLAEIEHRDARRIVEGLPFILPSCIRSVLRR